MLFGQVCWLCPVLYHFTWAQNARFISGLSIILLTRRSKTANEIDSFCGLFHSLVLYVATFRCMYCWILIPARQPISSCNFPLSDKLQVVMIFTMVDLQSMTFMSLSIWLWPLVYGTCSQEKACGWWRQQSLEYCLWFAAFGHVPSITWNAYGHCVHARHHCVIEKKTACCKLHHFH